MNLRRILLSDEAHATLMRGYQQGSSPAFRKRYNAILLKREGRISEDVGSILGMHQVSVNNWLTRYEQQGIDILKPSLVEAGGIFWIKINSKQRSVRWCNSKESN